MKCQTCSRRVHRTLILKHTIRPIGYLKICVRSSLSYWWHWLFAPAPTKQFVIPRYGTLRCSSIHRIPRVHFAARYHQYCSMVGIFVLVGLNVQALNIEIQSAHYDRHFAQTQHFLIPIVYVILCGVWHCVALQYLWSCAFRTKQE